MWSLFIDDDGILHVMPANTDNINEPAPGHEFGCCCICNPHWDDEKEGLLIHEVIGGRV